MKLNRKGYLIVEIIVASVLAMGIAFFLVRLTISFSRKDEDIYKSITFTNDKNIITNKIMDDVNNYTLTKVEYGSDKNTVTFIYWDNYNLKEISKELVIDTVNKTIAYGDYKKNMGNALEIINMEVATNDKYTSIVIPIKNIYNDEDYSIKLFIPYAIEFTSDNMVFNYSGNGNIGFKNNVTTNTEGAVFNGNNAFVNCGLSNYDFNKKITIMIKVKFNDLGGYQHIIGNWESAGGGIVKNENNTLSFELFLDDDYKRVTSNTVVEKNKWYTIIGIYNGSKLSIYINGIKENTTTNSNAIKKSTLPFYIGGNPETSGNAEHCSKITVENALVYNNTLPESYVSKYINSVSSDDYELPSTNLMFYYKFK